LIGERFVRGKGRGRGREEKRREWACARVYVSVYVFVGSERGRNGKATSSSILFSFFLSSSAAVHREEGKDADGKEEQLRIRC
jgi:hypothetical protein